MSEATRVFEGMLRKLLDDIGATDVMIIPGKDGITSKSEFNEKQFTAWLSVADDEPFRVDKEIIDDYRDDPESGRDLALNSVAVFLEKHGWHS